MSQTIVVSLIQIMPSGYGHNKVTVHTLDHGSHYTVTSNTRLTDDYKTDAFTDEEVAKSEEARQDLVELVLDDNGIEYDNIEFIGH